MDGTFYRTLGNIFFYLGTDKWMVPFTEHLIVVLSRYIYNLMSNSTLVLCDSLKSSFWVLELEPWSDETGGDCLGRTCNIPAHALSARCRMELVVAENRQTCALRPHGRSQGKGAAFLPLDPRGVGVQSDQGGV